jgi:hypothetical protein
MAALSAVANFFPEASQRPRQHATGAVRCRRVTARAEGGCMVEVGWRWKKLSVARMTGSWRMTSIFPAEALVTANKPSKQQWESSGCKSGSTCSITSTR